MKLNDLSTQELIYIKQQINDILRSRMSEDDLLELIQKQAIPHQYADIYEFAEELQII